jgi:hypothetical protein
MASHPTFIVAVLATETHWFYFRLVDCKIAETMQFGILGCEMK